MFKLLLGAAIGAVAVIAVKDKIMPSSKEGQLASMVNNLTEQNKSLKSKCSELETRLAETKKELESLKTKLRHLEDKGDDDNDAILDLKKANKKLLSEKESLASELAQIKSLLIANQQETDALKDKLFELKNK